MVLVLDASVALSWFLDDETAEDAWTVLDLVTREGAAVPVIWRFELANGMLMAERRRRMTANERASALTQLAGLPITVDRLGPAQAWRATVDFASRCRLTVYDAAYVEAAIRLEVPLATFDSAMRAAAASLSVPLLPP